MEQKISRFFKIIYMMSKLILVCLLIIFIIMHLDHTKLLEHTNVIHSKFLESMHSIQAVNSEKQIQLSQDISESTQIAHDVTTVDNNATIKNDVLYKKNNSEAMICLLYLVNIDAMLSVGWQHIDPLLHRLKTIDIYTKDYLKQLEEININITQYKSQVAVILSVLKNIEDKYTEQYLNNQISLPYKILSKIKIEKKIDKEKDLLLQQVNFLKTSNFAVDDVSVSINELSSKVAQYENLKELANSLAAVNVKPINNIVNEKIKYFINEVRK